MPIMHFSHKPSQYFTPLNILPPLVTPLKLTLVKTKKDNINGEKYRVPINLNAGAFCVKVADGKLHNLVTDIKYVNNLLLHGIEIVW